jgi:hypothetical protein
VTDERQALLRRLGFRFGMNGSHAARTMMLAELRQLLTNVPIDARRDDYARAVVADNVLGKPTKKARELSLNHMVSLYAFDPANPIFRALRRLWSGDESAQAVLALSVALARDPLLRATQVFFLGQPAGAVVRRSAVEQLLEATYPDRFSPASLRSFAQNVSGTWTHAGVLQGRTRKVRSAPQLRPESVAMLLFLGYLEGRTGQRLFTSDWMSVTGSSMDDLEALTSSASHRGLLVFMNAGGVKEVRFPGYLTPEEEGIRQEISHVV